MHAKEIIESTAEKQGWNTEAIAALLTEFLDQYGDLMLLLEFLEKAAAEENGPESH